MKLLTWNVQQGGARRAAEIVKVIERHAPDVMILCELRASSVPLLSMLADRGWLHQESGVEESPVGSVGILSREPLVPLAPCGPAAALPGRWIEAWSPSHGAVIAGVYGPLQHEAYAEFWSAVRHVLPSRSKGGYVLGGDLNTGASILDAPNPRFFCSEYFAGLQEDGLIDLWRARNGADAREYSYHHRQGGGARGAGFRIDHMLASRSMADRVQDVAYDRSVLDARISDHAVLTATFS